MPIAQNITCSAVLTNYNHSQYLPHALEAVIKQTIPFDEVIIIDDCSTDNSVEIIQNLIKDLPHARLVQNAKNMGVVPTLNVGLQEARCDFIFYLAADDTYNPHVLEWADRLLRETPDLAMISGNARTRNEETQEERVFTLPVAQMEAVYKPEALGNLARKRCITFYGGANFIRRDAMLAAGGFLPELKWHCDWFLYLLVASRHGFGNIPEIWVNIRIASNQYSYAYKEWAKQGPVLRTFIEVLKEKYPNDYGFFRNNALMPTYDIQSLWMFLSNPSLWHYVTPLLVWRLVSYKLLRMAGKLVPMSWRATLRKWLRV